MSASILRLSVRALFYTSDRDAHTVHGPKGHSFTETMFRCTTCRKAERDRVLEDEERAPLIQQTQPITSKPMLADAQ